VLLAAAKKDYFENHRDEISRSFHPPDTDTLEEPDSDPAETLNIDTLTLKDTKVNT